MPKAKRTTTVAEKVEIEDVPGPVAEVSAAAGNASAAFETFDQVAKRKGIPTPNANWIKSFAECQKSLQLFEQMAQQASEVGDLDSQQHFEAMADKTREQLMLVAGKLSTCDGCTGCGS
ncbi:MAG: hypothetical protein U0514_00730 [Candidatus Andersenbacteria bacterium]